MRSLLCVLFLLPVSAMAAVPPGFAETAYPGPSLTQITGMAWAPDGSGRLFLIRKNGQVRVATHRNGELVKTGDQLATTVFATEPAVYTNSECGLIGLAFDPNFLVNRHVYFFVTVSASEQQIVRYTDSSGVGTQRTVIVRGLPTAGANHDGGALGFGPDGNLYWAIGDLGNGTGVDADLISLAAKVGRATPQGLPVNDNPFFDGVGPNNEFIWARGFRNPFTFTFRPSNGDLWVNSVGTSYEQVFVVRRGDHAGYNDFENNQPTGYITPALKYRTNGTDTRNLTAGGVVRAGGVVTFTTTAAHGFRKGERITVSGVTDNSFDGSVYVEGTPTPTTWTAIDDRSDASSGGGTATTANLGGSITGGVFYESTLFPFGYRGNFLFGDYNSGRLVRATFAADDSVETVDSFGTGFSQAVDMDVGPDGALYVSSVTAGQLVRVTPATTAPGLVVTPLNLRVVEGGQALFTVALAQAPAAEVTVTATRTAGDSGITILSGGSLVFTPSNWSEPQGVIVAAEDDTNAAVETATFSVSAADLPTEQVKVSTIDNNGVRLVLSVNSLSIDEGSDATFTVALSKEPAASTEVTVVPTGGDPDVTVTSGQTLTFTPANWDQPQTVTLSAGLDADNVDDAAVITVAAAGADARALAVAVTDLGPRAPTITSEPVTNAVLGAPYLYRVVADAQPAPTFSLLTSVEGQAIDPATGELTWTPAVLGTVEVTVQASNGTPPDAQQTFTIEVVEDAPPTVVLTRPTADEVVSGSTAEFFGDCHDDVGCVRAEFFVDGQLISTDPNTSGHYHAGGEHNRWDTTALAPGSHLARMQVYDTKGQTAFTEVRVCVGGPCESPDAGTGQADGGGDPPETTTGCGCGATGLTPVLLLGLAFPLLRRRRPAQR